MKYIAITAALVTAFSCGFVAGEKQAPAEIIEIVRYIEPEATPEPELVSIGTYTATAYCPCRECCGKTDGITASGVKATAGRTIAADISKLPYGSEVYIDGQKYTVEDKGGAIKGNRIDIYFDTHAEATEYGKRQVELYIEK